MCYPCPNQVKRINEQPARVTARDVAREAGVSQTTVSYVLNGRQDVTIPDATRQRVLDAARRTGYRANTSARSMRTGRFDSIGLINSVVGGHSTLQRHTLHGITEALARRGLHLTLAALTDDALTDDRVVPKLLSQWMADGLLLNYSQAIPERLRRIVVEHALPTIWMNTDLDADCVRPDDLGAAREATRRLIALGHRRIAYVGYPFAPGEATHYSVRARAEGYHQAMAGAGLAPRLLEWEGGAHRTGAGAAARAALTAPGRPTALVAYWPAVALVAFHQALTLGLRVPENLTIVTFSDYWLKEEGLPIATWLVPSAELGTRSVEALVEKIRAPGGPLPAWLLPFETDTHFLMPPHAP